VSDSLPSFPPPADEHPLRGRVLDVLIDDGLAPVLDDDGDVAFVLQEQKIFARCADGPPEMLRVFGQWRITPTAAGGHELAWQRAASVVNATHHLAKVGVHDGILVVAADCLVTEGAPLEVLVRTSTQAVLAAVAGWHQALGADAPEEGPY
jgi:hypothetical protein